MLYIECVGYFITIDHRHTTIVPLVEAKFAPTRLALCPVLVFLCNWFSLCNAFCPCYVFGGPNMKIVKKLLNIHLFLKDYTICYLPYVPDRVCVVLFFRGMVCNIGPVLCLHTELLGSVSFENLSTF